MNASGPDASGGAIRYHNRRKQHERKALMYIHSRTASVAFKLFIAIAGTCALLYATGLFTGKPETSFPFMFTNISNIAVALYFWCAAIAILRGRADGHTPWHPKLKYALMLAITVTWLVAHFMLNWGMVFLGGTFHPDMLVLHYVVPMCTIADWLLFDSKGHMEWKDPLTWPLFPLCYLVYVAICVLGFGVSVLGEESRWPYFFVNFDVLGAAAFGYIAVLLVAFVLLGFVYVAIDKRLAKK